MVLVVVCCTGLGAADAVDTGSIDDTMSAAVVASGCMCDMEHAEVTGDMCAFCRGPYLTGTTVNATVVNWMFQC